MSTRLRPAVLLGDQRNGEEEEEEEKDDEAEEDTITADAEASRDQRDGGER